MEFLQLLNEAQQRAVTAPLHPMLVLAGPGTGKTRTLVARIVYLIRHHKLAPHSILAVTFTNKAKEEMKHRLREELGDAASDLMIGTFHRFCMNVLRNHHDKLGLARKFAIADEPTQLLTLARVSRIQDARSVRTVLSAISSYRLNRENLNPGLQSVAEKWIEPYHQELRRNGLIDFDQILIFTRRLFKQYPLLVQDYQQQFTAILVDEFQDTDPIQYNLMKALAWQHRNIFVVADDDQSIFAWRGAHIENIEQYAREFECGPEQVIVLDQNYRSTQGIIDVATHLINCGPRFRQKQIQAASAASGAAASAVVPIFRSFENDEAEMAFILETIRQFTASSGELTPRPPLLGREGGKIRNGGAALLPFSSQERGPGGEFSFADIAVLYPNHAIGELLEARLLTAHIPCQLIKHQGIFDRKEVQKLLLLLKLLQNPDDDLTLEQFFQVELRNDVALQQIQARKGRGQTFRSTLYALLSDATGIDGIAHSALRRVISSTFGLISNMISYIEHTPGLRLPELINLLCTVLAAEDAPTIYGHARQLCDPLDIPGLSEAVTRILETCQAGGKVFVCVDDAVLRHICAYMLGKAVPGAVIVPDAPEGGCSAPDLILCLNAQDNDRQSERRHPGRRTDGASVIVGFKEPDESSLELIASDSRRQGCRRSYTATVTAFKLAQALTSARTPKAFRNYVVFDLETTSADTRTTRIVEIGATKIRDGEVVGEFSRLVNPEQPITEGAYNVHHISDDEVRGQPTFAQLLPEFLDFIGDDMLVAHNGLAFDFPITLRQCKEVTGQMLPNRRFDTLPLARRLFRGQPASVDALMQRFGIENVGGRHRALDDTIYLAQIFEHLQAVERSINRRAEHEELLELVAFGLYLERLKNADDVHKLAIPNLSKPAAETPEYAPADEEILLFQLGTRKLLSRFSELPIQFKAIYADYQLDLEILVQDVFAPPEPDDDGAKKKDALELVFSGREVALSHLRDLAETFKDEPLPDAMRHFLDHAALYNSQDDIRDVNAVNLLTIHSAKGLEFPVVFVSGVEKGNLPSFYSVREEGELREKKLDEQRRLFYVALTRAKQHVFVTYVNKRGEFDKKRSQFLIELGVESEKADEAGAE